MALKRVYIGALFEVEENEPLELLIRDINTELWCCYHTLHHTVVEEDWRELSTFENWQTEEEVQDGKKVQD